MIHPTTTTTTKTSVSLHTTTQSCSFSTTPHFQHSHSCKDHHCSHPDHKHDHKHHHNHNHNHHNHHDATLDNETAALLEEEAKLANNKNGGKQQQQIQEDSIDITQLSQAELIQNMNVVREFVKSTSDISELYMLGLKIPQDSDLMNLYFTLHALNFELAQIKSRTRGNPSTGMLRMSWWRASILSAIRGHPPRVPVLICLSYLAKKHPKAIVMHRLRNLLNWRESDLKWRQIPTLEHLETFAHNTQSIILYTLLSAMDQSTTHTDHAASHLGKAFGMTQLLRGTAIHAQNSETYLPAELCARHGVSESDIYTGQNSEQLASVVFEVADLAKGHLDAAREFASNPETPIPKQVFPLFYTSFVCEIYLKELEKANFNVFDPRLDAQTLRPQISWKLFKTLFTRQKF